MFTEDLRIYADSMIREELSENTRKKYIRDIELAQRYFTENHLELTKENLIDYKKHLQETCKTSTVNSKIISINRFLKKTGKPDLALKTLKEQNSFSNEEVMTQNDYERLIRIASRKGLDRDVLMMQIFYFTGIRVSELKFFTVQAVKRGFLEIDNKGKIRRIPIPKKLLKEAKHYIREKKITEGSVINFNGKPISRFTVYSRLKYIAGQARVKKSRVYPHSLRHLFAKNWLKANNNNVTQLADILGHADLSTTRKYTVLSLEEMRNTMEL